MKKLLFSVLSSISEVAARLEADPAILSFVPKEMVSDKATTRYADIFETDYSLY